MKSKYFTNALRDSSIYVYQRRASKWSLNNWMTIGITSYMPASFAEGLLRVCVLQQSRCSSSIARVLVYIRVQRGLKVLSPSTPPRTRRNLRNLTLAHPSYEPFQTAHAAHCVPHLHLTLCVWKPLKIYAAGFVASAWQFIHLLISESKEVLKNT